MFPLQFSMPSHAIVFQVLGENKQRLLIEAVRNVRNTKNHLIAGHPCLGVSMPNLFTETLQHQVASTHPKVYTAHQIPLDASSLRGTLCTCLGHFSGLSRGEGFGEALHDGVVAARADGRTGNETVELRAPIIGHCTKDLSYISYRDRGRMRDGAAPIGPQETTRPTRKARDPLLAVL